MFDSIIYIVLTLYLLYYLFVSEIRGLNFALKANFLTSFLAPVVAYFFTSKFIGESLDTKTTLLIVFILTGIIVLLIGTLTTAKAYIDDIDCKDNKIRFKQSLVHASKLLLVCMLGFIAVILSPILQLPFTKLLGQHQTGDPQKFLYMVVGFYMAFISLSGTVISYMPASKESCKKTEVQVILDYENNVKEKSCKVPELSLEIKDPSKTYLHVIEDNAYGKKDNKIKANTVKEKLYLTTRYFSIIK